MTTRRGSGPRRGEPKPPACSRFKGLGEMDAHEPRETCMEPATRNPVQLDVE
jgi:DNA gyrase/topoisomerase IV subunit B